MGFGFLDSIPRLKSPRTPLVYIGIYNIYILIILTVIKISTVINNSNINLKLVQDLLLN